MATLEILHFPDSRLRTKAKAVTRFDDKLALLVEGMYETMYAARGIGLAASQVDVHQRIIVVDVSEDRDDRLCLVNPEVVATDGVQQTQEGCLSVPETFENVERAAWIRVKAFRTNGEAFEIEAEGLLATCIQHEIDHLEGILFIDHLSSLKRLRIRKRFDKSQRHSS
jgi:peptide deformylase